MISHTDDLSGTAGATAEISSIIRTIGLTAAGVP
jgi:hypothetical protein